MAEGALNEDIEKTINCPICFEHMLDSRTLYPCVHTFCAKCVANLARKRTNYQVGLECPLCRGFVHEKEIRKNRLMNALINLVTEEGQSQSDFDHALTDTTCVQCESPNVTSKCLSCNIDLCQKCKDGHRRIPGFKEHKVVINTTVKRQSSMTDVVIYCTKHLHEHINANCKQCDTAICSECKHSEHKQHESESLSRALKRYRLMLKSALANITKKSNEKRSRVEQLKEAKSKLLEDEATIITNLGTHKDNLLAAVKKLESRINCDYDQISIDFKTNIGGEIKHLDIVCDEMKHALTCDDSVKVWTQAIVTNTDGGGLLTELQSGLLTKIQQIQNQPPTLPFYCKKYSFQPSLEALELLENVTLGEVVTENPIPKSFEDLLEDAMERITNYATIRTIDVSTLFESPIIKERDVNIPTQFNRMCLFQSKIWIPCPTDCNIKVFSPLDGTCLNTYSLRVNYPHSLQVLNNNQLLLRSCAGLHLLNERGEIQKQVHDEQFYDVSVGNDMVIGLLKKSVVIWNLLLFQIGSFPISIGLGTSTVCAHRSYIYVCESLCHIIHKYTINGELVQQFGLELEKNKMALSRKQFKIEERDLHPSSEKVYDVTEAISPQRLILPTFVTIDDVPKGELQNIHICGCDFQGNLLIANYKDLKVLSCLGEWSNMDIPVRKASDAIAVGPFLFVLHEFGEEKYGKTISIYSIQNETA